jgi:hypothetical protein
METGCLFMQERDYTMKLVCDKCEQKLDVEDRFCKRCGREIAEIIEEAEIETESTQISTPRDILKNRKVFAVAGIALAALVVIFSLAGSGFDSRQPAEAQLDDSFIAEAEEPYEEPYDEDISYDYSDSPSGDSYDEMDALINNSSNYTFKDLGNALAGAAAPVSSESLDWYTDDELWYISTDIILGELTNPVSAIFPDWGSGDIDIIREDDAVYVSGYVYADDTNGNNKKQYFEITFYGDLEVRQILIDGTYY